MQKTTSSTCIHFVLMKFCFHWHLCVCVHCSAALGLISIRSMSQEHNWIDERNERKTCTCVHGESKRAKETIGLCGTSVCIYAASAQSICISNEDETTGRMKLYISCLFYCTFSALHLSSHIPSSFHAQCAAVDLRPLCLSVFFPHLFVLFFSLPQPYDWDLAGDQQNKQLLTPPGCYIRCGLRNTLHFHAPLTIKLSLWNMWRNAEHITGGLSGKRGFERSWLAAINAKYESLEGQLLKLIQHLYRRLKLNVIFIIKRTLTSVCAVQNDSQTLKFGCPQFVIQETDGG